MSGHRPLPHGALQEPAVLRGRRRSKRGRKMSTAVRSYRTDAFAESSVMRVRMWSKKGRR